MLTLPNRVQVVEVGPRDGLQSLDRWIDTDRKVRMIDRLSAAGFPVIEATSFARPDAVPNLRDADTVMARIQRRPGTVYRALVPNERGAERAVSAGVDAMVGLVTVSETYTVKNQNMSVPNAVDQAGRAFSRAASAGIHFTMAIGMALFCPYEGVIPPEDALDVLATLHSFGIGSFYFAGSTGMEDPRHVHDLIAAALARFPDIRIGFHVHNVAGFGPANVVAAVSAGASFIEGSICGIGGGTAMPSAIGSVGNLATEDIVHLLNEAGVETGIDTAEARSAAVGVGDLLGVRPASHVVHAGTRQDLLDRTASAGGGR